MDELKIRNKGTSLFCVSGIERNVRGSSPAVIRREIRPEAVELPRRKDEGSKPLHRREEFRTREGDLAEKRTIKVCLVFGSTLQLPVKMMLL